MCINVPVLMTMYLRVYRLKRVFELYENYLKTMRVTLGSQIVDRQAEDLVAKSDYANTYSILVRKRGIVREKRSPRNLGNTSAYLTTHPANEISMMTHEISYLD